MPKEVFAVLEGEDQGQPVVAVVNEALTGFQGKALFAWHLSIILPCQQCAANGMPTRAERKIIDDIGDDVDRHLKADDNALLLARITWNGTRRLLYRVHDPEVANEFLSRIVVDTAYRREIDFRMEHDEGWKLAEPFLSP